MIAPEQCNSIDEIRISIDHIDQEIISLLGNRLEYVKAIVRYKKPSNDSIIAVKRLESVISSRREMAVGAGLDPDIVEKMYRLLIDYFISEEMKLLHK